MTGTRVLIAAAGTGRRAGLPYPKTLHPVRGRPILVRLLDLLRSIDSRPVVIVSPAGRAPIAECLAEHGLQADLVEQAEPTGMGDAILCVRNAPPSDAEHLLVVWGDVPLIQPETLDQMRAVHAAHGNDFTFVTRHVDSAYTVVSRDQDGRVRALSETREAGSAPVAGERDIGLFIFRERQVLDLLAQRLEGAVGKTTGEHGFLYIVRHLVERGLKVEALPIATEFDLVSLNQLSDLDGVADA